MTKTDDLLTDLGAAAPSPDDLRAAVAHLLAVEPEQVEVVSAAAEPVAYDVPSITTVARWWVRGEARVGHGEAQPFAFFVKHVQAWSRSPFFAYVPEGMRELAAAGVPWRTEAALYRSDLAGRLPTGLRVPRAHAVHDLADEANTVWLDAVEAVDVPWTTERYARAAYLLGRLAASPAVAPLARVGDFPFRVSDYVHGRVAGQVVPTLMSDVWEHPALGSFAPLRGRLLATLDRLPAYAEELDALPVLTAHGDAAPNNLLATADAPDGFTLIDFGFWNALPVGFDLGQLLVGDVAIDRQPASRLAEVEAAIVPAYVDGLRAEGCDLAESVVRRAHALQVFLFSGVSALPFEMLDLPPDRLAAVAEERAALCAFTLDLVDATG